MTDDVGSGSCNASHAHGGSDGLDGIELRVDHDRYTRTGIAEAVYAPGKSPEQCAAAVAALLAVPAGGPVLLTRADPEQCAVASATNPGPLVARAGAAGTGALHTLIWRPNSARIVEDARQLLILTAGTADLSVAHEASAVMQAYGFAAELIADVGVAGLHRILLQQNAITNADLIIVVAGMEGALPSVVAGMTRAPVIAVPTSTGYGSGLQGVTALLAMLASCSPGITVVGIDNGFGAGCAAVRYLNAIA